MPKGRAPRKKKKKPEHPKLSEDDQAQLEMLLGRVAAQDPEGESFDQFLESLRPLLQRSLPFGLAFVRGLGSMASPSAVKTLQALKEIPAQKSLRRALKTALYRLGRQGLIQEEGESEPVQRVLVPRPADRQPEAWVSWPESQGERGIVLKLPDAGRGYVVTVAVLDSEGGFKEFDAFQTTRKGVRTLLEEMTGGMPGRLVEVPVSHLRYLLEEAGELHIKQEKELPPEYEGVHKYLTSWTEAASSPYVFDLVDVAEITGDSLTLRGSDSLLEMVPFISWRLPEEAVQPFADKIKGLSESQLVISQSAQLEQMDQIFREAASELFTPELRQRYRRMLEESALLLWLQDRPQEAKRALAAAGDLEQEIGRFSENNFVLGLVKRSIGVEIGVEQQDSEARAAGEKTTESGLIIPGR
jgi:hypothetical protein